MKIENLKFEEITESGNFVKQIFDEFVAADYTDNGIKHFYEKISEKSIRERFLNGSIINVAKIDDKIIGYIEMINLTHIYLLFVEKKFQNKGIAGKLIKYSLEFTENDNPMLNEVTVNSTLSAVKVYEKLGFIKMADYQLKNDILSFPMKLILK